MHEYKVIPGTPFAISKIDDEIAGKGYVILTAGYPATAKIFPSPEEAEKYIKRKPWDLIVGLTLSIVMKNNTQPFKIK